MNPKLLELMICLRCGGELNDAGSHIYCGTCNSIYPINRGVPIMLANTYEDEQSRIDSEKEILNHVESVDSEQRLRLWAETIFTAERVLDSLCESVNAKTVLNVGCGLDKLFKRFDPSHTLFVNSDIVDEFLIRLVEQGCSNVVCADIRRLPFRKESFDVVVCMGLLHHFYTIGIEEPLLRIADMVKPGGGILIQEPNRWGFLRLPVAWMPHSMQLMQRRFRAFITGTKIRPADYEDHLSKSPVIRLLKSAGFENVKAHPTPAYPGDGRISEFYTKIARKSTVLSTHFGYNWLLTAIKRGGVA